MKIITKLIKKYGKNDSNNKKCRSNTQIKQKQNIVFSNKKNDDYNLINIYLNCTQIEMHTFEDKRLNSFTT